MQWLQNYAVVLVLVALIAAISEMLLSNTPYQKYVKVLVGIVMIIAVVGPIFSLAGQEIDLQPSEWGGLSQEDYQKQYDVAMRNGVREKLEQTAKEALASRDIDVIFLRVVLEEDPSSQSYLQVKEVQIRCDRSSQSAAEITANALGIRSDQVVEIK